MEERCNSNDESSGWGKPLWFVMGFAVGSVVCLDDSSNPPVNHSTEIRKSDTIEVETEENRDDVKSALKEQ